ncbi:hypothetical protein [Streptomyces sp. ME19-01-6]|uniref:hypothetical protein n=1 Tax=Streptomyces sp. ME19-01-6 TaxID=3028686 RepID=UPI0029A98834|nr:hypothetical protein [Streptomyces sp. ME19-01-6]MDX3232541.1 hypothetical protein [Streptomyces sp. ME19-01-6]
MTTNENAGDRLSEAHTVQVLKLLKEIAEQLPDDLEGQQRAFDSTLRSAWVDGEEWALEVVSKATRGAVGGV